MWPFNKEKIEIPENPEGYDSKDPFWFEKNMYKKHFFPYGNWGVIEFDEMDGFCNYIELLDYMEKQGWIFISHSDIFFGLGKGSITTMVFRKKEEK